MAKRMIDTEIWKKEWFLKLSPKMKMFWIYLITNCNHAGIWEVNFTLAEFMVGDKLDSNEVKEILDGKIREIDNGEKWFIPSYVPFQYSSNNLSNVMKSVMKILKKYGLDEEVKNSLIEVKEGIKRGSLTPPKPLKKGSNNSNSYSNNKDKDYNKGNKKKGILKKKKYMDAVFLTTEEYEKLKEKLGKDVDMAIEILNNYKMAKGKRYKSDYHAIFNWVIDKVKEKKKSRPDNQKEVDYEEKYKGVGTTIEIGGE